MTEYLDLSLLDKVQRRRRFINSNNGDVIEEEKHDGLPEDLMPTLENHVGDGEGRVTVSGALSSSHEYHKAEAFVSISVSCNNNMDDVGAVHDLVLPRVEKLVYEDHHAMSLLRDDILPKNKRKHKEDVTAPTQDAIIAKPPRRTSGLKLSGKNKPDFRRK